MKNLFYQIGRFIVLLSFIQIIRAILTRELWLSLCPAGNTVTETIVSIIAFCITGLVVLLLFRPAPAELGLSWHILSGKCKAISISSGILLVLAVLETYYIGKNIFLENIKSAIVIPVFEELIFRGYGWRKIETAMVCKHPGFLTWLTVSALFALWHTGYIDIFYLKILPANPGASPVDFLLWKIIFTFFFGLIVGFLRLYSGTVYGCLILHGFLNLFGK